MKISELIAKLQAIKQESGDLLVLTSGEFYESIIPDEIVVVPVDRVQWDLGSPEAELIGHVNVVVL